MENEAERTLRKMKIHDSINFTSFRVIRVVGGWIYTFEDKIFGNGVGDQCNPAAVFVPEI